MKERERVKEYKRLSGGKHSQIGLFNNEKKELKLVVRYRNSANVIVYGTTGVYISICLSFSPSIPCQVFMTGLIFHSAHTLR